VPKFSMVSARGGRTTSGRAFRKSWLSSGRLCAGVALEQSARQRRQKKPPARQAASGARRKARAYGLSLMQLPGYWNNERPRSMGKLRRRSTQIRKSHEP